MFLVQPSFSVISAKAHRLWVLTSIIFDLGSGDHELMYNIIQKSQATYPES